MRKVTYAEQLDRHTVPEPNSGCILWLGPVDGFGYGMFTSMGGRARAHRASWVIANGPIGRGVCVLHKCDVPSCVNVSHLFLGTRADNKKDAVAKMRHAHGENHNRAKLTERDVIEIRRSSLSAKESAKKYGVGERTISYVRSSQTWKHVKLVADFMESL